MSSSIEISKIKSNDFCKIAPKTCSHRYTPYIYECGPSMCTSNQTECKEYMSVEKKFKLQSFINLMNGRVHYLDSRIKERFVRFKISVKNCILIRNKSHPKNVCIRERDCSQNDVFSRLFLPKASCPCPKYKPFMCGRQQNLCSIDREACDSFVKTSNKNRSTTDLIQLTGIKKCI